MYYGKTRSVHCEPSNHNSLKNTIALWNFYFNTVNVLYFEFRDTESGFEIHHLLRLRKQSTILKAQRSPSNDSLATGANLQSVALMDDSIAFTKSFVVLVGNEVVLFVDFSALKASPWRQVR